MPGITDDLWEKQHLKNLRALTRRIRQIYEDSLTEIAFKSGLANVLEGQKFSLSAFPLLEKEVSQIISKMHGKIYGEAIAGIKESWVLSNKKNDVLVDRRLADLVITDKARKILYDPNLNARDAFITRKQKGLNLSERVWNTLEPFKKEVEQGLGFMIADGKSAAEGASQLKAYLKEPDRLYRRVRGKDGKLHLSKAAQAYSPKKGVYRSSYKNALRLTRTETNIAYRGSDFERWNNIPFVVAIEIRLSNRHPKYDICDNLKGRYPKDFKFTGWHPQCICNAVAVQMTDEEFDKYQDEILQNGYVKNVQSVNQVADPPKAFGEYLDKNKTKINRLSSKPYWVKDNPEFTQVLK